ncbi:MAG: hypothetical protein ING61_15380, partial [Rhodocyclaceae bacterium]|nr:hypothetical protein [Rhodocyclaceae bacterium]
MGSHETECGHTYLCAGSQPKFLLDTGPIRREARAFEARIPKGATNGQRLRLRGQGGKGLNGGRDGDLYLNISLNRHALYRVDGHNLYLDLPIA